MVQRSALCRSRRELSNEYFLAKFGFDTAENERSKVCPSRPEATCQCKGQLRAQLPHSSRHGFQGLQKRPREEAEGPKSLRVKADVGLVVVSLANRRDVGARSKE